jgi:outer membrane protein OmpA-like peptidoglycan-associated protein
MMRRPTFVIVCGSFAVLGAACATKSFVHKQVSATETKITERVHTTETKLTQRADIQETKLRETEAKLGETADRAGANRQAIDEVGALATVAKTQAESAAVTAQDAEARLARRLADRNVYRLLETRAVYFDPGRAEIRTEDFNELENVANALKADPNAVLELQGFADPRGSDRYNNELARERVEAAMRYLVQRRGIELRQLRAIAMGKDELAAGEKPGTEALAKARRVEIRLFAPWSSWEDRQAQTGQSDEAGSASPPTIIETDRSATPTIAPQDALTKDAVWIEIIKSISPQELGAKD